MWLAAERVGWFSVLERREEEEVRTSFASNPVEVSIAAARQGRDALPALGIPTHTHSRTLSHTLLPTRDQFNPQENCKHALESSNPIDRHQQ